MKRAKILKLLKDCRGATIVEFAILAPVILGLFIGVLQIGIAMQKYNAMRNISADVARFAMVEYATGNRLSNNQIRDYAHSLGHDTPYLLENDRLFVTVTTAANQRVTGARELHLEITYNLPPMFPTMGIYAPELQFSRPIFVSEPAV